MDENIYVQKHQVINHLKKFGEITSQEAWKEYGITRLSAVIYVLRKAGFNIETIMEDGFNRYGRHCRYGRYVLRAQNDDNISS